MGGGVILISSLMESCSSISSGVNSISSLVKYCSSNRAASATAADDLSLLSSDNKHRLQQQIVTEIERENCREREMASDEYMEEYDDLQLYQCRRMSRLSVESTDGDDADGEISDENPRAKNLTPLVDDNDSDKDAVASGAISVPGTPVRRWSGRPIWAKEYSSDAETKTRRRTKGRRWRDQCLDRAWEVKKSREAAADDSGECRVLVRPRGRESPMRMDMDEVRACRDLGLGLPCDWTVEIPGGFSAGDTSSGGDSPVSNWMISSPGDDPKDVKARLKAWAQAVALASASVAKAS